MAFRKALGWGGLQSLIRIGIGFFSAKVSAVYLGPAGMALVGQLGNFIDGVQGAIGVAPNTAVTNFTSQRCPDQPSQFRLWSTAMRLTLGIAGTIAVIISVTSPLISRWLFDDGRYWPVVVIASVGITMAAADAVLMGAVNGLRRIRLLSLATIIPAVIGSGFSVALTYLLGVWGGLLGISLIYVIRFPISFALSLKAGVVRAKSLFGHYDPAAARDVAAFYPMLLAHAVSLPLGQILVRNAVASDLGFDSAGYLQATWRLSDMYVGVLTTTMGLFFMAHFAGLRTGAERSRALQRVIIQLFVLATVAGLGIFVMRDAIIGIVLTKKFLPVKELLPLQLGANVAKMLVYPVQMALASQRKTLAYAFVAVAGPGVFVILTYLLLPMLGVRAAPAASLIAYATVFAFLLVSQRRLIWSRSTESFSG